MRNGIIKKAPVEGRFSPDGSTIVPYVALELYSEFEIGFREIRKETTRVMLINAAANWWKKLDFKPSIGDEDRHAVLAFSTAIARAFAFAWILLSLSV